MLVCHKDGEETNNSPDNLYYGTDADNARDREWHRVMREEELHCRDDSGFVYVPDPEFGF
jgi:hypothetical protein